jgi:serine phosphatase RsbU (regulator of sigma subunit)
MATNKKLLMIRLVHVLGGLVAVALVGLLTWINLTAPLDLHRPVPSQDGNYFAYFSHAQDSVWDRAGISELVIATPGGRAVSRYPMEPGELSWSSSGNLMVVRERPGHATLITSAGSTFIVVTSLALTAGTQPSWARSGTKLAYVRSGTSGPEIAVYDLLQTFPSLVSLPPDFHLDHPVLLFWSPGGQDLYFLNTEGTDSVLYKLQVLSGNLQTMARMSPAVVSLGKNLPEISPDGTKIYVPQPVHAVIDAETASTLWNLPAKARALWSPWSADGAHFFYFRSDALGSIFAHEFTTSADSVLLTDMPSDGFFSDDLRSFFYRVPTARRAETFVRRLHEWLSHDWGWQHVDMTTRTTQPLGRVEIWPWETTREGLILISRDEYSRVRYGLYDPSARSRTAFHFPTDREVVMRQFKSRFLMLLTIAFYGLLGIFVFATRSDSAPARALYALSMVLMVVFTSLDVSRSLISTYAQWDAGMVGPQLSALGWEPLLPRSLLMQEQLYLSLLAIALVPPALLRFAVVFPEGNRFFAPRKILQAPFYFIAFLPAIGILAALSSYRVPEKIQTLAAGLVLVAGGVAICTAFFALLFNLHNPPDRRARDQVRWVALAFSVPVVGGAMLLAGNYFSAQWLGERSTHFLGEFSATGLSLLFLFSPLAIGYALLAHKLFDIRLLFRRTVHYSLLMAVVIGVYLLLVGGLGWLIAGTLGNPPLFVIILSILFTAVILAPARRRLERLIDRTFARDQFYFHETLQSFAQGLANVLDLQTLASAMSKTIRRATKAQSFQFFVLDRHSKKLRLVSPDGETSQGSGQLEFDPAEPLCRYLVERNHPFEVEVSPYDPKLIPIFQTAADRLSRLQAAVIFGLVRRRELTGLMMLGGKVSGEFYNSEELALLQTVANQAAVAIENTELLEEVSPDGGRREMEIVGDLPAQIFPGAIPKLASCQIAGRSVTARSISGDYHDFVELRGGRVGLAIGDVSGKGASAALLTATLQGLLRSPVSTEESLAELVRRINRQLFASSRGAKYCTFFFGAFSETDRRLEFVNAGHNSPLVLGPKGERFLESTGVPLGLFAETTHEVRSVALEQGATLILYSDGITEARDAKRTIFGVDRLVASAKRAHALDAPAMVEAILNDVREFTGTARPEDDRTLVLLKVNPA